MFCVFAFKASIRFRSKGFAWRYSVLFLLSKSKDDTKFYDYHVTISESC